MRKIALLIIIIALSCKNSESNTSQSISVDEIAATQLGKNFERKDNGDYSLCYSVDKSISKRKTAIVVDRQTGRLIYGPKKINADIDWFSATRLIIKEYPEVIKDKTSTDTFTYYYDLIQQKKINGNI